MKPSFQISVDNPPARSSLAVLGVQGELDAISSPRLEAAAAEAISQGADRLLLDLSGVSFMGSAGLRALVAINEMLRARSGSAETRRSLTPASSRPT